MPAPEKSVCTRSGLITLSAKKPMTTLGMPARVSRIGFRIRRSRAVGVLGQVDRRARGPSGRRDHHRDDRDDRACRRRSCGRRMALRRGNHPSLQSAPRRHLAEELDRLPDQRDDDRDADQDGRARGPANRAADDPLLPATARLPRKLRTGEPRVSATTAISASLARGVARTGRRSRPVQARRSSRKPMRTPPPTSRASRHWSVGQGDVAGLLDRSRCPRRTGRGPRTPPAPGCSRPSPC